MGALNSVASVIPTLDSASSNSGPLDPAALGSVFRSVNVLIGRSAFAVSCRANHGSGTYI
jgi:hypothetical protein